MRRIAVELCAGRHALNVLAASGDHEQPFLLACLDWLQEGDLAYVQADRAVYVLVADPASPGNLIWQKAGDGQYLPLAGGDVTGPIDEFL